MSRLGPQNYPHLCLLDNNGSTAHKENDENDPEVMKTHFISMLRYMNDNPKTVELFCLNEIEWEEVIDYVEQNGLQLFGFAVTAKKEAIIAVADDPAVSYVYTTPAM